MKAFITSTVALLAVASFVEATFVITTAAAGTAAVGAIALTGGTATALALGGGVLLLKGLAIAAIALAANSNRRGRRAINESDDAAFVVLANSEPAQCYRRLICDLATGTFPKSENDIILSLFNKEASIESPKFEFSTAAKLGKQIKNVEVCELRYSCPLNTAELQSLLS